MKLLFSTAVLFFSVTLFAAAPKKLALTGEAVPVALITAELSQDGAFDLLERSEVDRILREHKLAGEGLAGLFPHTDLFAMVGGSGVVVFNAKNGYRLADRLFNPETEPAERAGFAATEIRRAAEKAALSHPVCISTVAVRDVGVPRRLKDGIEKCVAAVERLLLDDPRFQLLERGRLGLVNGEREFSGKEFVLTPSSCLLTFEFEPGSTGREVNVKVLIHDLSHRKIGRVSLSDVFGTPEKSAAEITRRIRSAISGYKGGTGL